MEKLTCELNGIKYLLVKYPIFKANKDKAEKTFKKFECITQGVEEIKIGGLFSSSYMIVNILVPEKNVIEFNNYESGC